MIGAIRKILVLALSVACAAGEAQEAPAGAIAFEITLVVTDRGGELFDSWDRTTGKPFSVKSIGTAKRGKFLSALVMFKGCKADGAGNCDADVDYTAYDPSGKVYGKMHNAELWRMKPAPSRGFTQLSRDYMGIVIEPNDPVGAYRVTAVARDRNAKTEARAEVVFAVGM
jgi:hypothetical protein